MWDGMELCGGVGSGLTGSVEHRMVEGHLAKFNLRRWACVCCVYMPWKERGV